WPPKTSVRRSAGTDIAHFGAGRQQCHGQTTTQPGAALDGPYRTGSMIVGPHPKCLHPSTRGLAVPLSQYTAAAIQCDRTQHVLVRIDADDCLHTRGLLNCTSYPDRQARVGSG